MHIAIALDLEAKRVSGTNTLTVRGVAGADGLTLDAVGFEACAIEGDDATGRYDGEKLHVYWATPFAEGEERTLTVAYEVVEPVTGMLFSRPDEVRPDLPWFAASDNETERARHWLPCVDHPSVAPTLAFDVRADAKFVALANGERDGEELHEDGTKTTRWRLDVPCPSYITCVAVGDFVEADGGAFEDIPIRFFATKDHDAAQLARSFDKTGAMLAWMTDKLGTPFPYPKYFQFAVPGIGGAMENISLVSWDDSFLLDEALALEATRLVDQINVHEMAHSYFGNLLVCRDFAHVWLKESWATYMEQCWFEDTVSADEAAYEFYLNAHAYFFEADSLYKRPIVTREFNSSWQMFDRHLYPGGACRLHTLRSHVGDDAFWRGVRDYVARHAHTSVETDDFRRCIERASGRSLGAFFDQWFHGKGYPSLYATYSWSPRDGTAQIVIEQKQIDPDNGVKAFAFDLEIGWTLDGELHTRTVRIDGAKHTFVFAIERDPDTVRIDPAGKVLHRLSFNPGDDKLKRQLTDAPDAVGRLVAAVELIKTGRRANIAAVGRACSVEPFWGVRVEAARELGSSNTPAAADVLLAAVDEERDPRVLEHLYTQLGNLQDDRITARLRPILDNGLTDRGGDGAPTPLPHRARKAAYEALGSQREAAPIERLIKASNEPTYNGFAQGGALTALGRTRMQKAWPRLMEAILPGATPDRARHTAVAALGNLGRFHPARSREREATLEALVKRLQDPVARVRHSAVAALKQMQAVETIDALEAAARAATHQDAVDIEMAIDAIRAAARAKPGGSSDEVTKLRDELRTLKDTVQRLEATIEAQAEAAASAGSGDGEDHDGDEDEVDAPTENASEPGDDTPDDVTATEE